MGLLIKMEQAEMSKRVYIRETLKRTFGSHILAFEEWDILTIVIQKDALISVLKFLYSDATVPCTFLTDLCGIHFPDLSPPLLGVVYHLHAMSVGFRLRLKVLTPVSDPHIPTATVLFSSANWMERETYDFYGIVFEGHPDLRRILNMDEMAYFPMRKEYPLEDPTRDDKSDVMFGREGGMRS